MRFTIGYINHNNDVFEKHLNKSLKNLRGEFDIISTSCEDCPAKNYNKIIDASTNDWIILTHQDISFSEDLLEKIELTMKTLDDKGCNYSALGLVGIDINTEEYRWSNSEEIYELETCDCCFMVINKNNTVRFDSDLFNDFHLYVEDYCVSVKQFGSIYTIFGVESYDSTSRNVYPLPESYIIHHSETVRLRGFTWGRYFEYKEKLNNKWGRKIKTT